MNIVMNPLLIPKAEPFYAQPVRSGFSSSVWHVKTDSGKEYAFRYIPKCNSNHFSQEAAIVEKVAGQGLGPTLVNRDTSRGEMLLEYISHYPWPEYSSDSKPYKSAMIALRMAHQTLTADSVGRVEFTPFSFISKSVQTLTGRVKWLPEQFSRAVEEIDAIYRKITPWLEKNAVLCHGDFHRANVLIGQHNVFLIDWTTAAVGHPFFDVAKFTLGLDWQDRLSMLEAYLGHEPSAEEKEHFRFIDLALLVLVAANRFRLAFQSGAEDNQFYTKQELEEKLESLELPSFLTVDFKETSPKARQLGAIYALQEFQKRSAGQMA